MIFDYTQYHNLIGVSAELGLIVFSDGRHLYVSGYGVLGMFDVSDKGVSQALNALLEQWDDLWYTRQERQEERQEEAIPL